MHGDGATTNPIKIFANIFISFIGAGILGLPFAFREAGVIEGVLIMSCVAILSTKAMLLVVDCKYKIQEEDNGKRSEDQVELMTSAVENGDGPGDKYAEIVRDEPMLHNRNKELDYGDVGYHALGYSGKCLVDTAIVVSQTGFCCAYLIFISKNMSLYIPKLHIYHLLAMLLPPLLFLSFIRQLNKLAIFSLVADFANVFAYGVVFWFDFEHVSEIHYRVHPKTMSFIGFPFFLGIAIYCYEGAGMILSLEASVAKEKKSSFRFIFKLVIFLVTLLYIMFGVCGYLSFGPHTEEIITLNLPKGMFPLIVRSCLCFSLFFTYPIMMFPVIKILETRFFSQNLQKWKGNTVRLALVAVTGLVVVVVPNFGTLMALVGASCCSLLAFILPAIFHLKIFNKSLTKWDLFLDIFLIVLGVIGTIIGTVDALKRLFPSPTPMIVLQTVTLPSS